MFSVVHFFSQQQISVTNLSRILITLLGMRYLRMKLKTIVTFILNLQTLQLDSYLLMQLIQIQLVTSLLQFRDSSKHPDNPCPCRVSLIVIYLSLKVENDFLLEFEQNQIQIYSALFGIST